MSINEKLQRVVNRFITIWLCLSSIIFFLPTAYCIIKGNEHKVILGVSTLFVICSIVMLVMYFMNKIDSSIKYRVVMVIVFLGTFFNSYLLIPCQPFISYLALTVIIVAISGEVWLVAGTGVLATIEVIVLSFSPMVINNELMPGDSKFVSILVFVTAYSTFLSMSLSKVIKKISKLYASESDEALKISEETKSSMNTLMKNVSEKVEISEDKLSEVSAYSSLISESSNEVSSAMTTVATDLTSMFEKAQIVKESVIKLQNNINTSVTSVNDCASAVEEYGSAMHAIFDTAISIETEVDNVHNAMDEMNIAVKEVNNLMEIVSDIAFETNLLSLNASIEAARAGEHGRGFGVVADEIGKLAKQTADSTELVKKSLNSLRDGSKKVYECIDKVHNSVEQQREKVSLVEQTDTVVKGKTAHVIDYCGRMTKQSTNVAEACENIMNGLSSVSATAQEVTANMESLAETTVEINKQIADAHEQAVAINEELSR